MIFKPLNGRGMSDIREVLRLSRRALFSPLLPLTSRHRTSTTILIGLMIQLLVCLPSSNVVQSLCDLIKK